MQSLKQNLITDELDAVERGRPNRNTVSARALGASNPVTHNGRAAHTSRERPPSKDIDADADERDAEEQQVLQRRIRQPLWSLDRGTGYYQQERVKHKKASLLETGRCGSVKNHMYSDACILSESKFIARLKESYGHQI